MQQNVPICNACMRLLQFPPPQKKSLLLFPKNMITGYAFQNKKEEINKETCAPPGTNTSKTINSK